MEKKNRTSTLNNKAVTLWFPLTLCSGKPPTEFYCNHTCHLALWAKTHIGDNSCSWLSSVCSLRPIFWQQVYRKKGWSEPPSAKEQLLGWLQSHRQDMCHVLQGQCFGAAGPHGPTWNVPSPIPLPGGLLPGLGAQEGASSEVQILVNVLMSSCQLSSWRVQVGDMTWWQTFVYINFHGKSPGRSERHPRQFYFWQFALWNLWLCCHASQ